MQDLSNETMVHVKKEGAEYLQFKRLLEYKDILTHCFTLKNNEIDFRNVKGDRQRQKKKEASYQKISQALGISVEKIVIPNQTHTDHIEIVSKVGEICQEADGLMTNQTEIAMVLSFADCTPILLFDPVKKVIGNIHSGWRGTLQRIGPKAVTKMIQTYGCDPRDIIACIGPCIGSCHFEVEVEVEKLFEAEFSSMQDIIEIGQIKEGIQKYQIDTTKINCLALQKVGLQPNNIIISDICTVCHQDQIHSHRAEREKAGRNISIMLLKKG